MAVEAATAAPRDKGIWVGIVLWGVILLLIAAVAGVLVFANQYEPLSSGTMSGLSLRGMDVETYGDQDTVVLTPWRSGETFFAGFTIYNHGPVAVTVERLVDGYELGVDGEPGQGFEVVDAKLAPEERFVGATRIEFEDYADFTPFTLEPGDERRAAIVFRLNDCVGRNEVLARGSLFVDFSVWGIDREMEYPLPYNLVADGEYREGC